MKVLRAVQKAVRARTSRWSSRTIGLGITDKRLSNHLKRIGMTRAKWSTLFAKQLQQSCLLVPPLGRESMSFGAAFERTLAHGARARAHVFELLGSGPVRVAYGLQPAGRDGHQYAMPRRASDIAAHRQRLHDFLGPHHDYEPIDWHVDFISGYRWSADAWHADIATGGKPGADIKVPWELSRCYHLIALAQSWRLTSDRGFAKEIVAQVIDFVLANPVGFGPNWVTPMDVAIRVSNWLVSLAAVADADVLDDKSSWLIAKAVFDHARFIEDNLEWSAEVNGNHYTSNLVGLFFVGTYCPHLPRATYWRKFARERLEQEILRQVYADGCNFEGSTLYHRLVLEFFFYTACLARISGQELAASYLYRVQLMFDALRALCSHNGEIAQIGDNDSGRFLVIDSLPVNSLRVDHYLPLGDWFFERAAAGYASDVDASVVWWLGGRPLAREDSAWRGRESNVFRDAGWVVLRRGAWECIVSCGPNGQNGNGGHGHNDKLAISATHEGFPIVVDPGTYLYTANPAARNRYRSTAFHSTPQLVGCEQNEIPNSLFSLPDHSKARILSFEKHALSGQHEAFGHPVCLTLELTSKGIAGRYTVGSGHYVMRWLLHPAVDTRSVDRSGAILRVGSKQFLLWASSGELTAYQYLYSPSYGSSIQATALIAAFSSVLTWRLE